MEQKPGGRPSPAIYVPRGRRELNEKKELEEKLKREEETKRPASDMEISSDHSSPARKALRTNNRWILDEADSVSKEPASSSSRYYQPYQPPKIDDSEFLTLIDDDKLASSCLIITGIPIDMSDAGKSRVVEQYQQAGGVLRWIGNVAIVAFTNESIASRALKSNNKSMYRAELLVGQSAEYLAVAREIHAQLKPEITTRVANRLIGAALNIRIANTPPTSTNTQHNRQSSQKEEQVIDSWDS